VQCGNINDVHEITRYWLEASKGSKHQWVVCSDEIGQHWKGALPDAVDPSHDTIRHRVLWGNLMAGGGGVEWYFGYKFAHSDLSCEDWRSRDKLWNQTKTAIDFFHNHLPFHEMTAADELTADIEDYCLAKPGEVYAVYTPAGKKVSIVIGSGNYFVSWFNPRTGGDLTVGEITSVTGPGIVSAGSPPVTDGKDWVCLINKN
jgi:hypothetical protein